MDAASCVQKKREENFTDSTDWVMWGEQLDGMSLQGSRCCTKGSAEEKGTADAFRFRTEEQDGQDSA